jgi:hypothetical protein
MRNAAQSEPSASAPARSRTAAPGKMESTCEAELPHARTIAVRAKRTARIARRPATAQPRAGDSDTVSPGSRCVHRRWTSRLPKPEVLDSKAIRILLMLPTGHLGPGGTM